MRLAPRHLVSLLAVALACQRFEVAHEGRQLCLPFDPPIPQAEKVGVCGIPQ